MPKSTAYSPLDGLFDLACRDGVDIRPTLLRVLTDLYVQKPSHSSEEETQYVELALGLIDAVDAPTRAVVAARLASYPAAPEAVLRRLGGERAKPAADDLASQFFLASSDERRLILTNLDAAAEAAAPLPAANETIIRLEAAALAHNVHEFTRLLERALGVGHDTAARIMRDYSGEPIVVAAKALGMKAAVLQRILLVLNPTIGQSVKRVFDLAQLFDEITPAGAAHMLAIWRKSNRRAPPQYAPQFYDDEKRSARPQPVPTRQSAPNRPTARQRFAGS